jgi:hypothetical protein
MIIIMREKATKWLDVEAVGEKDGWILRLTWAGSITQDDDFPALATRLVDEGIQFPGALGSALLREGSMVGPCVISGESHGWFPVLVQLTMGQGGRHGQRREVGWRESREEDAQQVGRERLRL